MSPKCDCSGAFAAGFAIATAIWLAAAALWNHFKKTPEKPRWTSSWKPREDWKNDTPKQEDTASTASTTQLEPRDRLRYLIGEGLPEDATKRADWCLRHGGSFFKLFLNDTLAKAVHKKSACRPGVNKMELVEQVKVLYAAGLVDAADFRSNHKELEKIPPMP